MEEDKTVNQRPLCHPKIVILAPYKRSYKKNFRRNFFRLRDAPNRPPTTVTHQPITSCSPVRSETETLNKLHLNSKESTSRRSKGYLSKSKRTVPLETIGVGVWKPPTIAASPWETSIIDPLWGGEGPRVALQFRLYRFHIYFRHRTYPRSIWSVIDYT